MRTLLIGIATVVTVICIGLICNFLPTSPFLTYIGVSGLHEYLPYINYFVPIDFFVASGEGWLVALTLYIGLKFFRKSVQTVSELTPLS